MAYALGLDIGGSHISAAIINLATGEVVVDSYQEQHIDPSSDREILLDIWRTFILKSIQTHSNLPIEGIGIGIPGEFDYENGIALYDQNKFTQLYGVNIKAYLTQHPDLEDKDINFINDASAFAIGEHWCGAAQRIERVLMLTLGTGLGATFLHGGIVMTSEKGIPSYGTLYDKKYADGKADEYFSTRYFTKEYFKRTGKHISGARELAQLAENNVAIAQDIFQDFGSHLSNFLTPFIQAARTNLIVLGGNISLAYPLFKDSLNNGLSNYSVNIQRAKLGKLAGIIGAASSFR